MHLLRMHSYVLCIGKNPWLSTTAVSSKCSLIEAVHTLHKLILLLSNRSGCVWRNGLGKYSSSMYIPLQPNTNGAFQPDIWLTTSLGASLGAAACGMGSYTNYCPGPGSSCSTGAAG